MNQWVIKRTDKYGEPLEVFCTSKEEANAVIEQMRRNAERTQQKTQMEYPNGNPPFQREYDYHALRNFDELKYAAFNAGRTDRIFRLNTLPAESPNLVREILTKLDWFEEVELCWTCIGHTRSNWLGTAAAEYLKTLGLDVTERDNGDVVIRKGGAK